MGALGSDEAAVAQRNRPVVSSRAILYQDPFPVQPEFGATGAQEKPITKPSRSARSRHAQRPRRAPCAGAAITKPSASARSRNAQPSRHAPSPAPRLAVAERPAGTPDAVAHVLFRRFVADRGDDRRRLDHIVVRHLADVPGVSRSRVQAWVEEGRVQVAGTIASRPAQRVLAGVEVRVTLERLDPDTLPRSSRQDGVRLEDARLKPELTGVFEPAARVSATTAVPIPLAVLFEDDHLLVVDKPAGLVVHPSYGHRDGTLLHALARYADGWPSGRPSLVHRLDKWTSGVLLVAKSRGAHAAAARALARPEARKEYLALCYGRMRTATLRLRYPLGRDPRDRRRVVVREDGRDAETEVARLAVSAGAARGLTLVCCRLLTGRMHQIRVHLQAAGLPIAGDPLYGEPGWRRIRDASLAERLRVASRQMLHAWRLALVHPMTGDVLRIESPLPEDMAALVRAAAIEPIQGFASVR
jgi:23S rRNA pseudouridine1911/1915/1917 synthase